MNPMLSPMAAIQAGLNPALFQMKAPPSAGGQPLPHSQAGSYGSARTQRAPEAPQGLGGQFTDARPAMSEAGMQSNQPRGLIDLLNGRQAVPPITEADNLQRLLAENAAKPKQKGHKGLFPGKDWAVILGILGDAIAQASGRPAVFLPAFQRRQDEKREQEFEREKWAAQLEADRQRRMSPRIEQVGSSVGWLDPSASSFNPFYTAPQPFEAYARARGYEPGTPEYAEEVENYRLGTWGDPAMENRLGLEGVRYDYRDRLQDERLATSRRNTDVRAGVSRENNIRSTGVSRENNVRSTGQSNTNSLRSNETTRRGQDLRGTRGNRSAIIVNPKTGERMKLEGGRWVPVQ